MLDQFFGPFKDPFDFASMPIELLLFRGRYNTTGFTNFADFAKFVLTKLSQNDFKLLQFFVGIILILPFASESSNSG